MLRSIALSALIAASASAQPVTIADQLQACLLADVTPYEPISPFSFDAKARSGPEQPLSGRPCDGPKEIDYPANGPLSDSVIVSVNQPEVHDVITEGSVTAPTVDPTKRRVSVIVYTCSQDKLYGAGGRIDATITGTKQRIATAAERRIVLTNCLKKLGIST